MSDKKIIGICVGGTVAALLIAVMVLLVMPRVSLPSFHTPPSAPLSGPQPIPPPPPADVQPAPPSFTQFKKLDQFVGVECFYSNELEDPDGLSVVGEARKLHLMPMSKVVVTKVVQDTPDGDHPYSYGFKLYVQTTDANEKFSTGDLTTDFRSVPITAHLTLVIYPQVAEKDATLVNVPLCPVSDYSLALSTWSGKRFAFDGTKIGDIEVEQGTVVSISNIQPGNYWEGGAMFSAAFRLPSGANADSSVFANDTTLKPVAP